MKKINQDINVFVQNDITNIDGNTEHQKKRTRGIGLYGLNKNRIYIKKSKDKKNYIGISTKSVSIPEPQKNNDNDYVDVRTLPMSMSMPKRVASDSKIIHDRRSKPRVVIVTSKSTRRKELLKQT